MLLVRSLCKQLKISGRNFSWSKNLMCNVPEAIGTQKGVNVAEKKPEMQTTVEGKESNVEFTSVKGLKEFFDDQENWTANVVKVGRSWRVEELRIKSNSDLHKLWYVLLKEKNMLLTMKEEYEAKWKPMPNPERIDKVEESMTNIESVVRERNRAYHLLETGKTDERPHEIINDTFGLRRYHKFSEHLIPQFMNTKWMNRFKTRCTPEEIQEFLMLYKEKLWLKKKRAANRERNHVMGLIKRYPKIDLEMLKQQYPNVDVDKVKHHRNSQGHYDPIY